MDGNQSGQDQGWTPPFDVVDSIWMDERRLFVRLARVTPGPHVTRFCVEPEQEDRVPTAAVTTPPARDER